MPSPAFLTERQEKWFASVRDGLERETGRSVAEWAEIVRACPETAHRKRLAWMKERHGLGQNRASIVLNAAFPPEASWSNPDALAGVLWADPDPAAIHAAIGTMAMALPEVKKGQRKGFTAYSRKVQFAACRPHRGGVLVGLALDPATHASLEPRGVEGWSERLRSRVVVENLDTMPGQLGALLRMAWERS